MTNFFNDFRSHALAINACVMFGRSSVVFVFNDLESPLFSLESESPTLLAIRDYVAAVPSNKSVV